MTNLEKMMSAIQCGRNYSGGNVAVVHHNKEVIVTLHGNKIAVINLAREEMYVSWCGYVTPSTTKHLKPIIQHFMPYRHEDVKVATSKGDPVITVGDSKHVFNADDLIVIDYDKNTLVAVSGYDFHTQVIGG